MPQKPHIAWMTAPALFSFRQDLRLADNPGLDVLGDRPAAMAFAQARKVAPEEDAA